MSEIIKQGNPGRKKYFSCEFCKCEFTKTAEQLANMVWQTIYCPCCGAVIHMKDGKWEDEK